MHLQDFVGQPCKRKTAFDFLPKRQMQLDLAEICGKLREQNVEVEIETPVFALVKVLGTLENTGFPRPRDQAKQSFAWPREADASLGAALRKATAKIERSGKVQINGTKEKAEAERIFAELLEKI